LGERYVILVKKTRHTYKSDAYRINPFILPELAVIEAEVDRTVDLLNKLHLKHLSKSDTMTN
jgi:hypothetical protein